MAPPSANGSERPHPSRPAFAHQGPPRARSAAAGLLTARALSAAHWTIEGPARVVDHDIRTETGRAPDDAARRAKVGLLALSLPARIAALDLPASIRGRYPDLLRRMAAAMADQGPYDPDDYAKDVRLAVGASVPAGAQIVDLNDRAGSMVVARRLVRHSALALRLAVAGDLGHAAQLAVSAQGRPWLQHHTDARALGEFDEAGWRRFYLTAADLLVARPEAAGIFGASWFYDPQVVRISPKLAYLQHIPLQGGALQVKLPTDPRQVAFAIHRSATRRQLYVQGDYRPACYALLWPRRDLLAWAEAER